MKAELQKITDAYQIDAFLSANEGKKVVVIQGLGFVGAVMSLVCANAITEEYAVIGVDLPLPSALQKINSINSGTFPIISSDKKVDLFYENARKKGNLFATFDPYAYSKADVIIVDINLDVAKNSNALGDLNDYNVDLSAFKNSMRIIGENCKEDVLILVETTVPPGTCEQVVLPAITEELEKRGFATDKLKLGHSYERVMPGPDYIDSIQNFYRVYSGINTDSADEVEKFLKTIISTNKYPLTRLGHTNATEMAKVLENSYRAMNIAFMVEWSRFAERAGVNLYEIVNAIRMRPTHSNLMYPGIGVGGYCLTKDPLLASWSVQQHFKSTKNLEQSETGVRINDKMPLYAFEFLMTSIKRTDLNNTNILLLGVSYRSNVGDTRYSPVELFYNYCIEAGATISLHDPYVHYWEEKSLAIPQNFDTYNTRKFDVVVIATAHQEYIATDELLNMIMNYEKLFIIDTVGALTENMIMILKQKHIVKVLGRGDL